MAISLDDYRKAWIFRHQDMPLAEAELAQLKPLGEERSLQLWQQHISSQSQHPEQFGGDDWAAREDVWSEEGEWQPCWESDDPDLPEELLQAIDWADNTVVYFCYNNRDIIETQWALFRRHWKNFLFFDDGPLLLGKRRKEVIQFHQDGRYLLGQRPS
ncbi:DUF2947 domain-containing protein [Aestuariirhabdus sp. Z084]|uniref:DUF2947 domain-containing protein n=1 Tax=Aestuariirhabdus haliotis TaxID=2918751 RepID=UPI00201B4659|nr:DUF2947 domain-containing protein [Aestuariirhabdus haliotis]MCL6414207.1 DUF2947 domain-containing protein [Aestuariirhabdus haliotis]MCL6418139.1 DUF2947 domain-containing protein [Aestuariirhabdus haliotis]